MHRFHNRTSFTSRRSKVRVVVGAARVAKCAVLVAVVVVVNVIAQVAALVIRRRVHPPHSDGARFPLRCPGAGANRTTAAAAGRSRRHSCRRPAARRPAPAATAASRRC
jgi:hypothetical protein